jgi:uncharacterized membrane protein
MFSLRHIHPIIVHFPIALLLVGFVAEIVYRFFRKDEQLAVIGFWMLITGALTSFAAYFSGAFLTEQLHGNAGNIQYTHELFSEFTVVTALIAAALKIYLKAEKKEDTNLNWIVLTLYAIAVIFLVITGYYGGILVHEYMILK